MKKQQIKPFAVYSVDELAQILDVNRRTIYAKIMQGKIKSKKVGVAYKTIGQNVLNYLNDTRDV